MSKEEYKKSVDRVEVLFKKERFTPSEQQEYLELNNWVENFEKDNPEIVVQVQEEKEKERQQKEQEVTKLNYSPSMSSLIDKVLGFIW
jgi:hypothetical protein